MDKQEQHSTPESSPDYEDFRAALAVAKSIVILSGAGLSAASGIPTYRGSSNSYWAREDALVFSTPQGFKNDPSACWQFYHHRRKLCLTAKPNDAHRALAALFVPEVLARIAPVAAISLTKTPPVYPLHVTQNLDSIAFRLMDTLHTSVIPKVDNATTSLNATASVLEMHGSLFTTRCTSCNQVKRSYEPSIARALDSLVDESAVVSIPVDKLPRCGGDAWAGSNRFGNCGALLRPEVVWFGEVPPLMGEIARRMNWCDLLLIVGTSFLVHPAAGFASQVKNGGGKVAVFDIQRSKGDEVADFVFLGPCEETLPDVLGVKEDIKRLWPSN